MNQTHPNTAGEPPSLWRRIIRPHHSETDLHYKRVLELVAAWHFVTIPLGPAMAAMQVMAGEGHRVQALWLYVAPICTCLNYFLTRSRFGRQALWIQVVSTFLIVVAAIVLSPDRNQTTLALILPVLAAALCFGFREVLVVQGMAMSVVGAQIIMATRAERGLFIGTGVILIAAFAIIAAIVRHRIWLHEAQLSQLQTEAKRARALLEAGFDGTADVVDGRLSGVSDGFACALGMLVAEVEGQPIAQVLPMPSGSNVGRQDAVPFLDQKGGLRYLTVIRQVLPGGGGAAEVVAIRDQTHEQMHKANILFMDRMASIGTLASGVAHEVNNSLTALLGSSELGAFSLQQGKTEDLGEQFDAIKEAAQRISVCMTQLQTFGDRAETEPQLLDINDIVLSTVSFSRHQMRHVSTLETHLEEGLPDCYAVESWVGQILMNLLLNARDAVADREAPRIQVLTGVEESMLVIRVKDNGVGIKSELAEQIFQPFFTTKAGEGSGLGLSISASIAKKMGGALSLESAEEGAQFCLRLPVAVLTDSAPEAGEPTSEPLSSQRILLVDDEPQILATFPQLLAPAEVTVARSFEEVKQVWSGDYDLILSDIVMPGGTGLELRDWVDAKHRESLARFVLMTGSAVGLEDAVRELPEEQRILQKPIPRLSLLKLLQESASKS